MGVKKNKSKIEVKKTRSCFQFARTALFGLMWAGARRLRTTAASCSHVLANIEPDVWQHTQFVPGQAGKNIQ